MKCTICDKEALPDTDVCKDCEDIIQYASSIGPYEAVRLWGEDEDTFTIPSLDELDKGLYIWDDGKYDTDDYEGRTLE